MDTLIYLAGSFIHALALPVCWKYLALLAVLAVAALPLSAFLFHRGKMVWFGASSMLGLSLFNYGAWLAGHLGIPYTAPILYAFLTAGCLISLWFWRRNGASLFTHLRRSRRLVLIGVVVFLLAFLGDTVLRMHSPDIRDQEKFMDLAFLNSLQSNSIIPPADPWRYDLPINYYYGGYMQMATLGKMASAAPEVSYNISIPVLFALACLLVFSIAVELCGKARWGLLAICAVVLTGNLDIAAQNIAHWRNPESTKPFSVDWWSPSRVIKDGPPEGPQEATINEFPFFSFLHADLHPHLMAIPSVLLFLGLLLSYFQCFREGRSSTHRHWIRFAFLAWALGSLAFVNGFDFISFGFVGCVGIAFTELARKQYRRSCWWWLATRVALLCVAMILLASLLYAPFLLRYEAPVTGKPFVRAESQPFLDALYQHVKEGLPLGFAEFRSGLQEFLTVWGIQLLALIGFLASISGNLRRILPKGSLFWLCPLLLLAWAGFLHMLGFWVASLLPMALIWILALYWASRKSLPMLFIMTAAFASLCILAGCELVYVRDSYGRNLQRMNTLFKFYYAVWILLGISLPFFLREIWAKKTFLRWKRWVLAGAVLILLAWAMEYPVYTAWSRIKRYDRQSVGKPSLDGMRWMEREHPGDYRAILWLRSNARSLIRIGDGARKPVPVVLEAVGGSYTYFARISTYSGLRAVLGWNGHQSVWRGEWPGDIETDVRRIYESSTPEGAAPLLEKYGVDFIYIGEQERQSYPGGGLDKFATMGERIYADPDGSVIIYRLARARN